MKEFRNCLELPLDAVNISDRFWTPYQELIRTVVLPYQWEVLNDRVPNAEPSYCITNLQIAAGLREGEFKGLFFQDSDVAKWLEAVSYSLHTHPDTALEAVAEEAIALIAKAQQPDGYLNSYFTVFEKGKRWTNLYECHELYTAGHFIEAGVAWYQATGKRNLLDIVCKLADHIDSVFGPADGKMKGYDGHEEVELALARLYEATGNERYLKLSCFFLEERGQEPYFFTQEWLINNKISAWTHNPSDNPTTSREFCQAHKPVKEQRVAVGHAVRQAYLLTGMADVAMITGDADMLDACRAVWENIRSRQMYITGGVGSTRHGEAFTFDYDLPNDTAYAETCASVGLVFFSERMQQMESRREYADFIEKALFNLVVGAMSRDGKRYFYVNPLEVWPEACEKDPAKKHVKSVRQKWFGCACCPPNVARLLASLGKYIYAKGKSELLVHQYIGSEVETVIGSTTLKLRQESDYPWNGDVCFRFALSGPAEFALAFRIPDWCAKATLCINDGKTEPAAADADGYARIRRIWKDGDTVMLLLDMPVTLIQANPLVRADAGKVAIQRGPVIYCLEEADCGANLSALSLPENAKLDVVWDADVLGGTWTIQGTAQRDEPWKRGLYRLASRNVQPVPIRAIPYCMWGNREPGEMAIWIRRA